MKRILYLRAAIALALVTAAASLPASAQPVCHAENSLGVPFWGVNPAIAVSACQQNTPLGSMCYFKGCW